MPDDALERGEDIKVIEEGGCLIYWDGLEGSWLRMRNALELKYWR
ncbi:hypothetical protein [Natrinema sp. DC36]|nr:hypothetical protein [Natrinema sp. DC36]